MMSSHIPISSLGLKSSTNVPPLIPTRQADSSGWNVPEEHWHLATETLVIIHEEPVVFKNSANQRR